MRKRACCRGNSPIPESYWGWCSPGSPRPTARQHNFFSACTARSFRLMLNSHYSIPSSALWLGLAFDDIAMKYGIKGKGTVSRWVRQYGNGTRGKVIRVESPGAINELKRLKARVRKLESALADANIDSALEQIGRAHV